MLSKCKLKGTPTNKSQSTRLKLAIKGSFKTGNITNQKLVMFS